MPISARRFPLPRLLRSARYWAAALGVGLTLASAGTGADDGRVDASDDRVYAGAAELVQPLLRAARRGDLDRVRALLARGVAVDGANANGGTPLMYAAVAGREDVLALLIAHGADVNAQGANGWGALMLASAKGHVRVVRRLLAAGADVNLTDVYRWTPLMRAVYEGRDQVMQILLQAETVNVNAVNDQGGSALHLAAIVGDQRSVRALVDHGADVGLRDHAGRTALDIAEARGDTALVRLLRSAVPTAG